MCKETGKDCLSVIACFNVLIKQRSDLINESHTTSYPVMISLFMGK